MEGHPVIIFDGYCSLCNNSVDWLMKRDKKGVFRFTANQHEAGKELLGGREFPEGEVDTIFLYENGQLYDRSTAVLRVCRHLPFPWNLSVLGYIIPRFIREPIYKWVARNRYKWFGKKDSCRMPTPEERARFLM